MRKIFECKEDGVMPKEFSEAGRRGDLAVLTAGMAIILDPSDFDGGRNGCTYEIVGGL